MGGAAGALSSDAVAVLLGSALLGGAVVIAPARPRAAWVVASLALLVTVPEGVLELPAYVLVPTAAFCAGRWDDRWSGLLGATVIVLVSEVGVAVAGETPVPFAFVPAAAWGVGVALREREEVIARLAERARELEAERDAHAQLSVRYERARIAAELHDVVAHAISVMVVQATAGQRLAAVDPGRTAETFSTISAAAREAEHDIGRLVELLADEEAAPPPGGNVEYIEELVARASTTGLRVTLRLEGVRDGFGERAGQTAFRVVREGLTNALRHASGADVHVLVRGEPPGLVVEVTSGPSQAPQLLAGPGSGRGITGLRERVGACGGTLDAGPTAGGGWRLRAQLPSAHALE